MLPPLKCFKMFYAKTFYAKTVAKMLQNIFSRNEHSLKIDRGYT